MPSENKALDLLHNAVHPAEGFRDDFDPLLQAIGDCRFVLIGEASHGTHEFYRLRAELTRRLITEKGFHAVVAEADWPDAYRVNRYVRGFADDGDATEALDDFKRFPQWMWRNADVLDFVGWLREFNDGRQGDDQKAGFYGMDLYSLHASIRAVIDFLDTIDHAAATRARYRYSCFDHFGEDPQAYGYSAAFDLDSSCQQQAVQELVEIRQRAAEFARRDGRAADDELFYAEQNARVVANAERYYRSMFEGRISSWNLRDRHMVETLQLLMEFFDRRVGRSKFVVWAHNSHLGDARATEVGEHGELNVGQLVREAWGEEAFNIGFSTYTGTVTAASDWDAPAERKAVRPALAGSYEAMFHELAVPQFLLLMRGGGISREVLEALREPRFERAIGVIYRPESERVSHYFQARLADQFDAMIHIDQTRAVEPLERTAAAKAPRAEEETYPAGV
jgi:erythromycin esterase-like protein